MLSKVPGFKSLTFRQFCFGVPPMVSTPRPSSESTASLRLSIDHVEHGLAGVPEAVDEEMGVGSLDAGHGEAADSVGEGDEAG